MQLCGSKGRGGRVGPAEKRRQALVLLGAVGAAEQRGQGRGPGWLNHKPQRGPKPLLRVCDGLIFHIDTTCAGRARQIITNAPGLFRAQGIGGQSGDFDCGLRPVF